MGYQLPVDFSMGNILVLIIVHFCFMEDCIVSKFPRSSGTENFAVVPDIPYNYLKDGDIVSTEGATIR